MKPRKGAMIAAAAVAACGQPKKVTPPTPPTVQASVASAYDPAPLSYPQGTASDFTACHGMALVCVHGGVAIAGGGAWVLDPSTEGLDSVGCAGKGDGWGLRGSDVIRLPADNTSPWSIAAHLPEGAYQLVDTGSEHPIIWGQVIATGHWIVARIVGAEGKVLYETTSTIGAVAQAGPQTLLVAADKRLVRVDAKGARTISVLDDAPDGVAVADDGVMFVSMPKGIVRMTKDAVSPVAVGIHGPLRMDQASLYVLLRDTNVVLRLTRK